VCVLCVCVCVHVCAFVSACLQAGVDLGADILTAQWADADDEVDLDIYPLVHTSIQHHLTPHHICICIHICYTSA
jgi:hypothetical protein